VARAGAMGSRPGAGDRSDHRGLVHCKICQQTSKSQHRGLLGLDDYCSYCFASAISKFLNIKRYYMNTGRPILFEQFWKREGQTEDAKYRHWLVHHILCFILCDDLITWFPRFISKLGSTHDFTR